MSLDIGAALLTISLASGGAGTDKPVLPHSVVAAGLKRAGCAMSPSEAEIVGTERLSNRLEIVEVSCWRSSTNAGSILFAVPENQPQNAQLLTVERWKNGKVLPSYSVSSPGYDPKTRTLSSTHLIRGAGDCGTIGEWKWTGWHFRLLNVWSKESCDGEPFEWDSREKWQVFPKQVFPKQVSPGRGLERDQGAPTGREHRQTSR
jgi:hypothetical protein